MQEKFGKDNIIQAEVHNDDATPHLQMIISNKVKANNGIYLSTGQSFCLVGKTKTQQKDHLIKTQMSFWIEVACSFGIEKPIEHSKETKKEQLSEMNFKRQQIAKEVLKNQIKLAEIKDAIQKVELSKARSLNYLNSRKDKILLNEI